VGPALRRSNAMHHHRKLSLIIVVIFRIRVKIVR
jgi:hypothetical protein